MSTKLEQNLQEMLTQKNTYLLPENLKKNVTVFGVTGTLEEGVDTSDATATVSDIVSGKTAYVNGVKLTGNYVPLDTSDANATTADIVSGKTAYVNGVKLTGIAALEDGCQLITDISQLPSTGNEGDVRIHVNATMTEFYGIYKYTNNQWIKLVITNAVAGEDYTYSLGISEEILGENIVLEHGESILMDWHAIAQCIKDNATQEELDETAWYHTSANYPLIGFLKSDDSIFGGLTLDAEDTAVFRFNDSTPYGRFTESEVTLTIDGVCDFILNQVPCEKIAYVNTTNTTTIINPYNICIFDNQGNVLYTCTSDTPLIKVVPNLDVSVITDNVYVAMDELTNILSDVQEEYPNTRVYAYPVSSFSTDNYIPVCSIGVNYHRGSANNEAFSGAIDCVVVYDATDRQSGIYLVSNTYSQKTLLTPTPISGCPVSLTMQGDTAPIDEVVSTFNGLNATDIGDSIPNTDYIIDVNTVLVETTSLYTDIQCATPLVYKVPMSH